MRNIRKVSVIAPMSVNFNSEVKKDVANISYIPEQYLFCYYLTCQYSPRIFEALKGPFISPICKWLYRPRLSQGKMLEYLDKETSLFHNLSGENLFEQGNIRWSM